MDSKNKPLVFTCIFLSFLLQSPCQTNARVAPAISPASANSPLYKDICNKTNNIAFCLKTLESDPRTASASTVLSLGKIAIDLAIKDSNKTWNYISDLANSSHTKPELKQPLSTCFEDYGLTYWAFTNSYRLIEADPPISNYNSMIAADYAGYCEKQLKGANAHIERIATGIQNTMYFSNIGNVITTILWESSISPSPY